LQKKYSFPKTVSDLCRVLAGWKHRFNSKYNRFSEANDGIAFPTTTVDTSKKGKGKNKTVTC